METLNGCAVTEKVGHTKQSSFQNEILFVTIVIL
jgi:hypothetical protein